MPTDYKKEYFKEIRKSRYAWGQYYQLRNELFDLQTNIYDEVNETIDEGEQTFNENHNETNSFLMSFIRELYKKAKHSVECPICLEQIDGDELETTSCGHNYHRNCLAQLKASCNKYPKHIECAVCRKNIFK